MAEKRTEIPATEQEPDGKVTPEGPQAEPEAPAPTSLLGSGESMIGPPGRITFENQSGGNDRAAGR